MLSNKKLMKSKRGQVASTATWVIATIIIVVILTVFYFVSTIFVAKETLTVKSKKFIGSIGFTSGDNLLATKTSIAYLLTGEDKRDKVDKWLDEKDIDIGDYIND